MLLPHMPTHARIWLGPALWAIPKKISEVERFVQLALLILVNSLIISRRL
jgi:hypothetical protein